MKTSVHRRAAFALLSTLLMLASLGPGASADPQRERLEAIEQQIDRTQERIEEAEEERQGVLDELEESDAEREALAERIADLGADLDAAEARLAEVERELEVAQQAVVEWGQRLDDARERLRDQQETLEQRAAMAYKIGPAGYLSLLLGAEDLGSLSDRLVYLDSVLTIDSNLVSGLETTRTLVGDNADLVADYETEVDEQRRRVQTEVDRIAEIRAQQEAARDAVLEEINEHEALVEEIESTKAKWEEAVAELQADSTRIQGLLQSSGSTGSGTPSGGNGELFWPTAGSIGSGFGWRTHPVYGTQRFHAGVDIGGACGQPIWAAEDGTVISAGYSGGYGNFTVVDHGNGLATAYAHQTSFAVSGGQSVSRGQVIGYVGTTGLSTGCHLHFEVRVNGSPVDPVPYLT